MTRQFGIAVLTMVSMLFTGASYAGEKENAISAFGTYQKVEEEDGISIIVVSYERLFQEHIGLNANVGVIDAAGDTAFVFGLDGRYYFTPVGRAGSISPYVGGRFQLITSDVADATIITGFLGVEVGINESASFFLEIGSGTIKPDSEEGVGYTQGLIGIKYRF